APALHELNAPPVFAGVPPQIALVVRKRGRPCRAQETRRAKQQYDQGEANAFHVSSVCSVDQSREYQARDYFASVGDGQPAMQQCGPAPWVPAPGLRRGGPLDDRDMQYAVRHEAIYA